MFLVFVWAAAAGNVLHCNTSAADTSSRYIVETPLTRTHIDTHMQTSRLGLQHVSDLPRTCQHSSCAAAVITLYAEPNQPTTTTHGLLLLQRLVQLLFSQQLLHRHHSGSPTHPHRCPQPTTSSHTVDTNTVSANRHAAVVIKVLSDPGTPTPVCPNRVKRRLLCS